MAKEVVAIYPGSFDPVTNGHVDIIGRSQGIFDRVIVAVLANIEKTPFFTTDERLEMLREVTGKWDNVQIETFQGLLVNYAVAQKAQVILRGIRAVTDYEYEFQMALMNRRMQPGIENGIHGTGGGIHVSEFQVGERDIFVGGLCRRDCSLGGRRFPE